MITISDEIKTIQIDDEDQRVIETDCYSFIDWLENAAREKVRRVRDRIILDRTDKNPQKISFGEKKNLVKDIPLELAKERNKRLEEMRKK